MNFSRPLFLLLFLAVLTRFWNLGYPVEAVFDEVHFGKYVSAYFTQEYYFDVHPPLGKLMLAGAAKLFGFQPGSDFDHIGEVIDVRSIVILRFLPALFGVLFVAIVYWIGLALNFSRPAAFLGGFLALFDNALLIESRFILLNLFLLSFGFAALCCYLHSEKTSGNKHLIYYGLAACFAGLAAGIKFTGASFFGLILLFVFITFLKDLRFKKFLLKSALFIAIAGLIYILPFTFHFALLPKSGPGDAFMSSAFHKTLIGNRINAADTAEPLSFFGKFSELNVAMYNYHSGTTAYHPDGSRWYEWPFDRKAVYYWTKSTEGATAKIYLMGNPFIWWLTSAAIALSFILITLRTIRGRLTPEIYFLFAGYFANLLPFILISRVTFIYHYLSSLVFALLIAVLVLDRLIMRALQNRLTSRSFATFYAALLLLIMTAFLLVAPLSYGLPIPPYFQTYYDALIHFVS